MELHKSTSFALFLVSKMGTNACVSKSPCMIYEDPNCRRFQPKPTSSYSRCGGETRTDSTDQDSLHLYENRS